MLGLTLNHENLDERGRTAAKVELERSTGLPAVWPLLDGAAALVPAIRDYLAAERRR